MTFSEITAEIRRLESRISQLEAEAKSPEFPERKRHEKAHNGVFQNMYHVGRQHMMRIRAEKILKRNAKKRPKSRRQ